MKHRWQIFVFLMLTLPLMAAQTPRVDFQWKSLSLMAVQDGGRLKPLDTFSRESLRYITGKEVWKGLSATEVVFGWFTDFEPWSDEPFILVDFKPLKESVGLDKKARRFSLHTLQQNPELPKRIRTALIKQRNEESLTPIEQKSIVVHNRLSLLLAIRSGQNIRLLPNPNGVTETWFPLSLAMGDMPKAHPYNPQDWSQFKRTFEQLKSAFRNRDSEKWNKILPSLLNVTREKLSLGKYPSESDLKLEAHYNQFRPFRWSWLLYTLSFLLLFFFLVTKKRLWGYLGTSVLMIAFSIHTYGFVIRSLVSGRPPVTNMYESVVWASWGCIFVALLVWAKYKSAIIPAAATVFSIVSLILADSAPSILDPSIHPLQPVLRSSFWLTVHVLTITLSYAAFGLALCIGNVILGAYAFKASNEEQIQNLSLFMYRSLQLGVVLLAAGTILGGVWADYSWGRFWGWDPKEVWALIALLLYLAVLHGKFTSWLSGFGFAASTVISFLSVLMAWYGVNFILGAGLHSYGFATGGTPYVVGFCLIQLGFIGITYYWYWQRNNRTEPAPIPPKEER